MEETQSQPQDVNILLLGESGVGKSTFINSLANYLEYDSLEVALHSEIKWKVPARFTVTDESYEEIDISIGNAGRENYCGHIVTQGVTNYEFAVKGVKMNLIDTPPLGAEDDEKNMKEILSYISKLNHLNAIVFFLKPNISILSQYFKHCLYSLLSRLNTSISKNIVFVFTHTRSTFYKPGETLTILTKVLKDLGSEAEANIPYSRDNMFCLDNETFRYLVAFKRRVMSEDGNMKVFSQSWKLSSECCKKIINYIVGDSESIGLEPCMIRTPTSPKQILETVVELFSILADISLILHENMEIVKSEEIRLSKNDIPLLTVQKVAHNKMIGCWNCVKISNILEKGNVTFSEYKCFQTELIYNNNNNKPWKFFCSECKCKLTSHKEFSFIRRIYMEPISKDKDREIELTKLYSIFFDEMEIILGFLVRCQVFRKSVSVVNSDVYKDFLQTQIEWKKAKKSKYDALKKTYNECMSRLSKEKILSNDIENKLKTVYDLKFSGQMLRNIHKERLPQNEIFKKPSLELCKTKDDMREQNEPQNFKRFKSDSQSKRNQEKPKFENTSITNSKPHSAEKVQNCDTQAEKGENQQTSNNNFDVEQHKLEEYVNMEAIIDDNKERCYRREERMCNHKISGNIKEISKSEQAQQQQSNIRNPIDASWVSEQDKLHAMEDIKKHNIVQDNLENMKMNTSDVKERNKTTSNYFPEQHRSSTILKVQSEHWEDEMLEYYNNEEGGEENHCKTNPTRNYNLKQDKSCGSSTVLRKESAINDDTQSHNEDHHNKFDFSLKEIEKIPDYFFAIMQEQKKLIEQVLNKVENLEKSVNEIKKSQAKVEQNKSDISSVQEKIKIFETKLYNCAHVSGEDEKKYINILLLGETGVGKSTFINSFANYIQFDTVQSALEKDMVCLIPTKFTIPDENYFEQYIEIGNDMNENQDIGSSSTQCTKSYVFPMEGENCKIRLIDTPGIGDSRGIEQDNKNFENVLDYLSQYEYLHAICFLLKPNVSIITAYFKFCLMHLLSRLEKSAVNNIIFIFTNTRSTLYRPGETLTVLRKILKEIESVPPHISIPCNKQNIFCMDNEAFRFLVALKHDHEFTDDESENFSASWEISVRTSKKMLDYLAGSDPSTSIKPHVIRNTLSVNEARRIITDLSKPLVDISDMIQDNLTVLERHENDVSKGNQSIEEFEDNLFVPCVQLHQIELSQPATICTADKCSERVVISGTVKYHYKQKCHQPCFLPNVPSEHIGAPELMKCFAMRKGPSCTECGCDFSTHMHISYETKTVGGRQENEAIKNKITCTQEQIEAANKLIATLTKRKEEYEHESDIISKTLAKFAHFIKEHSITVFNDAYEDYLDYLIARETNLAEHSDSDFIKRHQNLKKQYKQEKQLLELVLTQPQNSYTQITTDVIYKSIKQLYNLKHTGSKIKELHQLQEKMRKKEHSYNTEYYHPTAIPKTIGKGNKKKKNSKAAAAELENLRQQIETMPLDEKSDDNFKDAVLQMLSKFGKSED